MITREILKREIDNVQDDYLPALYRIIKAFELPPENSAKDITGDSQEKTEHHDWKAFIQETYGCLKKDPIERGPQGEFETRMEIE